MYIITATKFYQDWRHDPNPIYKDYCGETVKECMAMYRNDSDNNDLAIYTSLRIVNVVNTDELD